MNLASQISTAPRRLLVLVASPRRDGNSAALAAAVRDGAEAAGHRVAVRFLDDHIGGFLRDCRQCRGADGECRIDDGFRALFFDDFLPADGIALCTPIYWYGMSAQAKAFFDRSACYYAGAYPDSARVLADMAHKQWALLLASEETYPGASLGIVHQLQEYVRYTHSQFIGVVHGHGNQRGEIARDPSAPLQMAERLGRRFFDNHYSDYRLDTPRDNQVWRQSATEPAAS